MTDRRLYTPLKTVELLHEIESYSFNNIKKRPPLGILKKILINLTTGNIKIINNVKIWTFLKKMLVLYSDINDGIKKLTFLIFEMLVSSAYKDNNFKYLYNHQDHLQIYNWLYDRVDKFGDTNALKLFGCIDSHSVDVESFHMFTNGLSNLVTQKLDDDVDNIPVEYIHIVIRLVQKITEVESDRDIREHKIEVLFNKLITMILKINDLKTMCAICDTLTELVLTDKYKFLKLKLNIQHVSKLITLIITKAKHSTNEIDYLLPSILTILTYYDIKESNEVICNDVIICVKLYLKSPDFSVVMNSIKVLIHYYQGIAPNDKIIIEIIKSFENLFNLNNQELIKFQRTMFFDCLRNFSLIIIKFNKILKGNSIILKNLISYIKINNDLDVESYIIDTKLEILYLLSLNEIYDDFIIDSLLPLIKCSNANLSYKTIRTLNNLIIKNPTKYNDLLIKLINQVSCEKNILALSICLKDLHGMESMSKLYIDKIMKNKNIVYDYLSSGKYKDDAIVSYFYVLGNLEYTKELIDLKEYVWSLLLDVFNLQSDKQIYIIDSYVTNLIKSWTKTGACGDEVLNILKSIVNDEGFNIAIIQRVEFYCGLINACSTDTKKLEKIVDFKSIVKRNQENDEQNVGLSPETVDELCHVFASLACVYLRDVRSIFRNG